MSAQPDQLEQSNQTQRPSGTTTEAPPLVAKKFPGFALDRLEVLNWGTFHQAIWPIQANSGATMIVGHNGCGKSSAADALQALLVPQRGAGAKFNAAGNSGSGSSGDGGGKGRDMQTYLAGAHKSVTDEHGQSKALELRPAGSGHYSVILALFKNEYTNSYVTLAWLMQLAPEEGGGAVRRHMYAEQRRLSIKEHFTGLGVGTLKECRTVIRDRFGLQPCETVESYWVKTRAYLGLTPDGQSQKLFAKGVATKEIHSTTDFARQLMIEKSTELNEIIQRAIKHFADLEASYMGALIAQAKGEDLLSIQKDQQINTKARADREFYADVISEAPTFFIEKRVAALENETEKNRKKLKKKEEEIEQKKLDIEQLQERLNTINQKIHDSGGGLAATLEAQIGELKRKLGAVENMRADLQKTLSTMNMSMPANQTQFYELIDTTLPKKMELVRQETEELTTQINALHADKIGAIKPKIAERIEQLQAMGMTNSNIDPKRIAIRNEMAKDLGLEPTKLPFFGEIVQVKASATSWAPAIERALMGVSQDILVPIDYEKQAKNWIERMEDKRLKGLIQTLKVPNRVDRPANVEQRGYLPEMLEYDTNSYAHEFARSTILESYNYLCTDDMDVYDRHTKALSKTGQVKNKRFGTVSFRKDTRVALGALNFLGWNNELKKARLKREIDELKDELTEYESDAAQAGAKLNKKFAEYRSLERLTETFKEYDAVDHEYVLKELDAAEKSLVQATEANGALKVLNEQKENVRKKLIAIEEEKEKSLIAKGELSKSIENLITRCERLSDRKIYVPDAPSRLQAIEDAIKELEIELELEDESALARAQTKVEGLLQNKFNATVTKQNESAQRIREAQIRFTAKYPEHNSLVAGVEHFQEWNALAQELEEMNMAKFTAKLRERFGNGAITDLNTVANTINSEKNRIKDGVEQLNETLRTIQYDRNLNTYIKLNPIPEKDALVDYFRQELTECLSIRTDFTVNLTDEQYLEHFKKVRNFIAKLSDPIRYQRDLNEKGEMLAVKLTENWLDHVSDIRNWYSFYVTEHFSEDHEIHYDHRNTKDKSGGELQKITYSLIGAAFMYNYRLGEVVSCINKGINDPIVFGERRFRTIMIDESFNNMDPENVKFAVDILLSLGLQPLIISPFQNMSVILPSVQSVCLVVKEEGKFSKTRNMSIEEARIECFKEGYAEQA